MLPQTEENKKISMDQSPSEEKFNKKSKSTTPTLTANISNYYFFKENFLDRTKNAFLNFLILLFKACQ